MNRRDFLLASSALGLAGFPCSPLWAAAQAAQTAQDLKHLGKAEAFDYAALKGQARALAGAAYQANTATIPANVKALDWDQYQSIRYRPDHALWAQDKLRSRASFFHLGLFFQEPVQMYELKNGQAQELAYDAASFDYGKSGLRGTALPESLGFAGFRINAQADWTRDVAAFLGASYFRAVGGEYQYGLSARGLAVDCGMSTPEEFPRFSKFWLERPAANSDQLIVYALLDSPSVAGAYRFAIKPGKTLLMDIDAALYPRKTIERIGIAPLTSMFQYGENDQRADNDWRPEIHDSDGLSMWRGNGEWIWRPLNNPPQLRFNAYQDEDPRGFGLLQRDRLFDHYQDDGVFYDRRPSVWVEPKSSWGKGSVQLVEIPTEDETFDNIVAFWNPADKPQAGQELLFGYRLYWGAQMPAEPRLAKVAATYTGIGGIVGKKRSYFSWRFVVDFMGGDLTELFKDGRVNDKLKPIITASRGKIEITSVRPLASLRGYRAMFDIRPDDDNGTKPIDLRLYLSFNERALSETWLYQWTPPAERKF